MPQHRRLTRPGAIHPIGYWQDTDPALDGPIAAGIHWFDTSLEAEGEIIERIRNSAADAWVVAPGGGTVKSFAVPLGNGTLAVGTGAKITFQLPGAGRFVAWRLVDGFESADIECDVWVAATGIPVVGDSVVGTTPPALTAAQDAAELVDPEDWTADWVAGSLCTIAVTSSAGCTGGTLQLFYVRT